MIEPLSEPTNIFARYVDDIIRSVRRDEIEKTFKTPNSLHPNLEFTVEHETNTEVFFLDLVVTRNQNKLSTSWYVKPSDTGVNLSYYACAPTKYKRNIVKGAIHRIHHTTSIWANFDSAVNKLTTCLEANQYLPSFYPPLSEIRSKKEYRKRLRHSHTPHCNLKEKRVQLEICL